MDTIKVQNPINFADRTKNGVPLPDGTGAAIVNTVGEVGVSEMSIYGLVSTVIASAAKQSMAAKTKKEWIASSLRPSQ